ncbi:Thiazole synthase [Dissostichus eleginoides]|uniref:Thiazole synthase n=1 Tax=Dissostichus eleginoides TaxID=100907 RepID=A0AAD9F520_DISEL|nr:Thiazole synthase [Dissostichus eleginoides]
MERWPALFAESQIVAEFCRVSSKNLKIELFKELDKYTPHFFDIFKSKGGSVGHKLEGYLQQVAPAATDVNGKQTAVLRGLPVILGDENNDFFKTCFDCDDLDISNSSIGILTVIPEDSLASPDPLHLAPSAIAIILEGKMVMDGINTLPDAMVLLSLGHKSLKPKLQSLKNALMQ